MLVETNRSRTSTRLSSHGRCDPSHRLPLPLLTTLAAASVKDRTTCRPRFPPATACQVSPPMKPMTERRGIVAPDKDGGACHVHAATPTDADGPATTVGRALGIVPCHVRPNGGCRIPLGARKMAAHGRQAALHRDGLRFAIAGTHGRGVERRRSAAGR